MRAAQQNWIPRLNHCRNLRAVPALAPMIMLWCAVLCCVVLCCVVLYCVVVVVVVVVVVC